jgi:hypothetical protein
MYDYVTVTIPTMTTGSNKTEYQPYCDMLSGDWVVPHYLCASGDYGNMFSDTFHNDPPYSSYFDWLRVYYCRKWYSAYGYMKERAVIEASPIGLPENISWPWISYHYMDSCNSELPDTSLPAVYEIYEETCGGSESPATLAFPALHVPE